MSNTPLVQEILVPSRYAATINTAPQHSMPGCVDIEIALPKVLYAQYGAEPSSQLSVPLHSATRGVSLFLRPHVGVCLGVYHREVTRRWLHSKPPQEEDLIIPDISPSRVALRGLNLCFLAAMIRSTQTPFLLPTSTTPFLSGH